MSRVQVIRCDRPECTNTAEEEQGRALPVGWLTLDPHASDGRKFELCSNRCVRILSGDREKADREMSKPPAAETGSNGTGNGGSNAARANLIRWHREGKHDDDPKEGCPECEAVTAP